MTPKNQQIIELFQAEFADFSDFKYSINPNFKCEFREKCQVDLSKETCCTGGTGSEKSKVMLIAESPSTADGVGCKVWGPVIDGLRADSLGAIINLINDLEGAIPYFTDAVKCGISKTIDKSKLNKRKHDCSVKFLAKEIQIIEPTKIFCIGDFAYKIVLNLKNKNMIEQDIHIAKLTHFSSRSSLTLSAKDKKEIIWPLELGLLSYEQAVKAAQDLQYLKAKFPNPNRL